MVGRNVPEIPPGLVDVTVDRLAVARAFDRARFDGGVGMSLGMWAGRGDWASCSEAARDRAGQRALTELDGLITQLTEFRQQLADAVQTQDGSQS